MPGGPSFRRPNYRRRRTITLLAVLGVVALAVVLLTRGGGGPGSKDNPIPTLAFVATTKHINQSKPASEAVKKAESDAIVKLFTDYYQEAYVDPRKWGDGKFEDLQDLFVATAKTSFPRDLESLTIGQSYSVLNRVDLKTNTLAVSIYYDTKSAPTIAVATIRFQAVGTLKKAGPKLMIDQTATFYLQKQGDSWKITSYDTKATQVQPSPSPSPSST
jgi:hypothetical protein